MKPQTAEQAQPRWRYFLLGLLAALALGGVVTVASVALSGGEARAAASDVVFSKTNGVVGGGDVTWTMTIVNNSDSSQVVEVSDTYQPNGTGTELTEDYDLVGTSADLCNFNVNNVEVSCALTIPANSTATLTIHTTLPAPQCNTTTAFNDAFARVGGLDALGSPDNGNMVVFAGHPELCDTRNVFQLCKQWQQVGVINTVRSFTFNVSDSSESEDFTISGVQEGGAPSCILLEASGLVTVTETVPSGYLSPEWDLSTEDDPGLAIAPNAVQFFLSSNECYVPNEPFLTRAQESISIDPGPDFKCTLTVTNRQVPTLPEPSPSPTSPPASCTTCLEPTATPTSTPVTPTATPTATNTPVPPATATPTTNSGVTNPGNAVDAAKTAAAANTPLPPRTGDTQTGATGTPLNVAVALAGLVTLAGGLAVLGSRSRRRR